jgi:hypothetical protein
MLFTQDYWQVRMLEFIGGVLPWACADLGRRKSNAETTGRQELERRRIHNMRSDLSIAAGRAVGDRAHLCGRGMSRDWEISQSLMAMEPET